MLWCSRERKEPKGSGRKGGNAKTAMATAGFCDNGLQYLSKSVPNHPP